MLFLLTLNLILTANLKSENDNRQKCRQPTFPQVCLQTIDMPDVYQTIDMTDVYQTADMPDVYLTID